MRKVLPLKGYKSLRAFNVFHTLLLGLKMLPLYQNESYESFFASFTEKSDEEKETLLREAICFVQLEKEEIEAAASFCTDKNEIAYGPENVSNLSPTEIMEVLVSVCMEIGRMKVDLVTESEKKKFQTGRLTSSPYSPSIPQSH